MLGLLGLHPLEGDAAVQLGVLSDVDLAQPTFGVQVKRPVTLTQGRRAAGRGSRRCRSLSGGIALRAWVGPGWRLASVQPGQALGAFRLGGEGIVGQRLTKGLQQGIESGVEFLDAGQATRAGVEVGGDGFQSHARQMASDEGGQGLGSGTRH
jgi:hypothetical protein